MYNSKLPIIALPHPLILLPASRFTMPVSREIGEALLSLIDESDTLPIVAAIPITNQPTSPNTEPLLAEWGTAARVLRLVKPPARNSRQPYLVSLHGLTRVRLIHTKHNLSSEDLLRIPMHGVEYPPTEKVPTRETANKFKQSALRLLDRLAKDSLQQPRKEGVTKVILSWANRKDVEHDVAPEVRNEMQFLFVRTVREALDAGFGRGTHGWRGESMLLESRLQSLGFWGWDERGRFEGRLQITCIPQLGTFVHTLTINVNDQHLDERHGKTSHTHNLCHKLLLLHE